MRPKKVILCVYENEQELSVMRFLLNTSGYRVMSAENCEQAIEVMRSGPEINMVLVGIGARKPEAEFGYKTVQTMKSLSPGTPIALVGDPAAMEAHVADVLLSQAKTPPVELLDRIKLMSMRKRGPRKRPRTSMPPQVSAVA